MSRNPKSKAVQSPPTDSRRHFLSRFSGAVVAATVIPHTVWGVPVQENLVEQSTQANQRTKERPTRLTKGSTNQSQTNITGSPAQKGSKKQRKRTQHKRRQETKKPRNFQAYITRRLEELIMLTSEEGPIRSQILTLQKNMAEIQAQIDHCNNLVGDYNDIAAVQQTLGEIKELLKLTQK